MALTKVQRVRIIFDLLKDGDVTSEAAYASVDLFDAAKLTKWVDRFIAARHPDMAGATNEEKADLLIKVFRRPILGVVRQLADEAGETARQTEKSTLDADFETDLGGGG